LKLTIRRPLVEQQALELLRPLLNMCVLIVSVLKDIRQQRNYGDAIASERNVKGKKII